MEWELKNKTLREHIRNDYLENRIALSEVCIDPRETCLTAEDKLEKFIDYKNLKELYVINTIIDCDPVIIKCKVTDVSLKTITILVKERYKDHTEITENGLHAFVTSEYYKTIKINKKYINIYQYSTTYARALANLLLMEKTNILRYLQQANSLKLFKEYAIANEKSLIFGLEYIARRLNLKYLFRLEDDTFIKDSNGDENLILPTKENFTTNF